MVKNHKRLEKFEKDLVRRTTVNPKENLKIVEALFREARALGAFPPKDPLEGIEVDIKIAKAVNCV